LFSYKRSSIKTEKGFTSSALTGTKCACPHIPGLVRLPASTALCSLPSGGKHAVKPMAYKEKPNREKKAANNYYWVSYGRIKILVKKQAKTSPFRIKYADTANRICN
jgi:hypothetical protein